MLLLNTDTDEDAWRGKYDELKKTEPKNPVLKKAYLEAKKNSFSNEMLAKKFFSKRFKDISKPSSADETWKGKMLSECKRLSSEIFKGEISNFTEFCIKP